MKIVVLAGGFSTERDVSLTSATMICNTLRDNGHQAVLVDSYLGIPEVTGSLEDLFVMDGSRIPKPDIHSLEPDLEAVKAARKGDKKSLFGPHVIELCQMADICYMGLHGGAGEDGRIQAALDCLGVKYTGSGYMASAVAMHKGITKTIFQSHGVPTPEGFLLKKADMDKPLSAFGYSLPCVLKICMGGSSVGVYIPETEEEYKKDLEIMFRTEEEIMVEKYVKGREFAVGVLAGKALPVIEIIPRDGWFDYEHKYQDGFSREVCPAEVDEVSAKKMQEAAVLAAKSLMLEVYSRMDFLLDANGDIYCLEANSLPGMTPASLIPKEARAAGIAYEELCELLITESLKKYEA